MSSEDKGMGKLFLQYYSYGKKTLSAISKIMRKLRKSEGKDRKRSDKELTMLAETLEKRLTDRNKELAETNEKLRREVAEHKQTEERMRRLAHAIEQSSGSILITDSTGVIEYVNPKFTQITGYTSEEVIGENPRILKSRKTPEGVYQNLWQTVTSGKEWRGTFCNTHSVN
mgnify:FL=1